jgi:hypothetical protein
MYGLVNKAIKSLVMSSSGESAWQAICAAANITSDEFEALAPYPDHVTYDLVRAASQHLNISPETLLKKFGHHWVKYTAEQQYGEIMNVFGKDFRSCVKNLNRMHSHIAALMPALQPPRFLVSDEKESSLTVHYHSVRAGLSSMVIGLLEGLSIRYNEPVSITHVPPGVRSDHDEFDIVFRAP